MQEEDVYKFWVALDIGLSPTICLEIRRGWTGGLKPPMGVRRNGDRRNLFAICISQTYILNIYSIWFAQSELLKPPMGVRRNGDRRNRTPIFRSGAGHPATRRCPRYEIQEPFIFKPNQTSFLAFSISFDDMEVPVNFTA